MHIRARLYSMLLVLILPAICSAQTTKTRNTSVKTAAENHRQMYNNSCIPMSIELVLKHHQRVKSDFYGLQNVWKNKLDGTFANFDGKTIGGLTFKQQFAVPRGDNFPFQQLFSTIDQELAAGRKVIISLPSGINLWHMFVIDSRTKNGDYVAYSRSFDSDKPLVLDRVKSWVFGARGTDIMTYR